MFSQCFICFIWKKSTTHKVQLIILFTSPAISEGSGYIHGNPYSTFDDLEYNLECYYGTVGNKATQFMIMKQRLQKSKILIWVVKPATMTTPSTWLAWLVSNITPTPIDARKRHKFVSETKTNLVTYKLKFRDLIMYGNRP